MEHNELEVQSPEVTLSAARDFAAALAETPQFKAFEQTYDACAARCGGPASPCALQAKVGSLQRRC